MSLVRTAAVVGAGTMGGEIAQAIAAAGIPVVLKDVDADALHVGLDRAARVSKDRAEEIMARIAGTLDYADLGAVDFVVEAVPEVIAIKHAVFAELDAATPSRTILASNTSALSITDIATAVTRPEKVVGIHFFYPAHSAKLIEVVEGEQTSEATLADATRFVNAIRKTPIRCQGGPGFVVNRILTATLSEIWRATEEAGATPEAVDQAITSTGVMGAGPYWLADRLGLDTVLHVAEHMNASYNDEFFHVSEHLRSLVEAGDLGVKTGKGFYEHS